MDHPYIDEIDRSNQEKTDIISQRNGMCHFKDAGKQTIQEILRWSIMECKNPHLTDEIQRLCTDLKLLISNR